jgi:hypothetical protein
MTTLNEAIITALSAYSGTMEEQLGQWLYEYGGGEGTLNERWLQFCHVRGHTVGTLMERKASFFESKGFTSGTINEREFLFFDGGADLGGTERATLSTETGREIYAAGGYSTSAINFRNWDMNGNSNLDTGDHIAGMCFPAMTETSCSYAQIRIRTRSIAPAPGFFTLVGEKNTAEASVVFGAANYPSALILATAANTLTDAFLEPAIPPASTERIYDVTALVQEMVAAAFYVGGYMNFMMAHIGQTGGASWDDVVNPPRLLIEPAY